MIRDYNIEWLEKRIFIPYNAIGGGISGIVDATDASEDTALRAFASATAKVTEIGTSDIAGLAIGADNDGVSGFIMAPYDLDIKKQVRFRVHFTQTADSGTVTWVLTYTPVIAGTTAIAAPTTALSTAIPAYTTALSTDNVWLVSDFGIINRDTLADTTTGLLFKLICTDDTPNAGLSLLGLEMRYTPRRTAGPRRNVLGARRMNTSRPLGVQLHSTQEGL